MECGAQTCPEASTQGRAQPSGSSFVPKQASSSGVGTKALTH